MLCPGETCDLGFFSPGGAWWGSRGSGKLVGSLVGLFI